jgi:hypothetical protein
MHIAHRHDALDALPGIPSERGRREHEGNQQLSAKYFQQEPPSVPSMHDQRPRFLSADIR